MREFKMKQVQDEKQKLKLANYLQDNINKGIPSTSVKDGTKFLHMIEEEDRDSSIIDNNTKRSNKSNDFKDFYLTAKEESLRLCSQRSGRNLTDDEEYLFMNLS